MHLKTRSRLGHLGPWKAFSRFGLLPFAFLLPVQPSLAAPDPAASLMLTETQLTSRPATIYVHTVLDPATHRISVKSFPRRVEVAEIAAKVECNGISITGGFSRGSGKNLQPEGLVRTASGEVSHLASYSDGGVLSLAQNSALIVRVAKWRQHPTAAEMALQGRPLLVFDGAIDEPLNRPERLNRVGVGILSDGHIAFIGAFTRTNKAASLREFAREAKAILGPKLMVLLNLDGGPSAFMRSLSQTYQPSPGAVTSYLCAERR